MIVRNHFKFTLFSLFLLTLSLFAFPLHANAETTLTVFAAASMTESMNMIAGSYKKSAPDVKIVYNFDSAAPLKTQIEQGGVRHFHICRPGTDGSTTSRHPKVNTKKLDLVLEGTRFNIVSNKVVMVVPKGT